MVSSQKLNTPLINYGLALIWSLFRSTERHKHLILYFWWELNCSNILAASSVLICLASVHIKNERMRSSSWDARWSRLKDCWTPSIKYLNWTGIFLYMAIISTIIGLRRFLSFELSFNRALSKPIWNTRAVTHSEI